MGNKGSKGGAGKSMRPPVKSDNRGFPKFGGNNTGRGAGVSAPAAPSSNTAYNGGAPPPAPAQSVPPPPSDDHDCK